MIRKLAKRAKGYIPYVVVTPLLVIGEVFLEVLIPTLMADIIDNGIKGGINGGGDIEYTVKLGVLLMGICLLSLIFGAGSGWTATTASAGFAKNLRRDMYYNIQSFSFANIDKFSASSIVTRLTTDVSNVQQSFQMLTRIVVRCPIMLITSLVMAIRKNVGLSVIFLAVIPLLGIGLGVIIAKAFPIFQRVFKIYDKLNNVVQENLHGIRVVKSFVREERENKKFRKVSGEIYDNFVMAEKLLAFNSPMMQLAIYTSVLLICWFGGNIIVKSGQTELSVGDLSALISYTMQILMSCMMISMVFVMLTMSAASAKRVVEVLDEKSDITNPENSVTDVKDGSIEFENVCFSYSKNMENLCIKNANLSIKSGMTVGIIGGTGSSKTSIVQLIPRLYDVTSGCVKVGGVDVRNYDIEVLRNNVSMVLQKNVLFSGTIKENIRWGKEDATDEEIEKVCKLAQADDFIRNFPDGYDTYIEQGGANVSGGQKQRLCIARAIIKKPKILILDDSTSAVDTKTDALIRKAFEEEIPDTTKIIIAQRISSVQYADVIIVMDNGVIVNTGTHEELLKESDIYREVYTSQTKGGDTDEQ
ncbi:MAG: ABC transporter ATP-binding protein [Clostridia bacterium]|nr:ABC transporter ATP-binding protein [Clostridia bacterium]